MYNADDMRLRDARGSLLLIGHIGLILMATVQAATGQTSSASAAASADESDCPCRPITYPLA